MVKLHFRWFFGASTSILLVFVCLSSRRAATIDVPADQPTMQTGIDAAMDGDTVLVAPGTYIEQIQIANTITLTSSSTVENSIISPNGGIAIDISGSPNASNVSGFTVTHGVGQGVGVEIARGSGPKILKRTISDNSIGGGALLCRGNNVIIRDCHFLRNVSSGKGG